MAFISHPLPFMCKTANTSSFICTSPQSIRSPFSLRARIPPKIVAISRSTKADTPKKQFLDRFKPLRNIRIIVRNDTAILESIATFDSLFFASIPSGEYANLVDASTNIDMHLLLANISGAKFETGVSRDPSKSTTYAIRILAKDRSTVALSAFVMWDKKASDVSQDRIDAWQKIKTDYAGDNDTFFFEEK